MTGRKYTAPNSNYRYGFNGKENDKDICEGGQDYGMRVYDSRVGRFFSVDPLTKAYASLTPYQFASNTPLMAIDLDGMEAYAINPSTNQVVTGPLNLSSFQAAGWITGTFTTSPKNVSQPQTQNKPVLARLNISESTCIGCAARAMAQHINKPIPQTTVQSAPATPAQKLAAEKNRKQREAKGGFDDSYTLSVIHRDNVSIVESSPINYVPGLGPLLKGGRYSLMGSDYNTEASNAYGTATIDIIAGASLFAGGSYSVTAGTVAESGNLGAGRVAAKGWLQSLGNLERNDLIADIEKAGFQRMTPTSSPVSVYERNGLRIRLDPPQPGTSYNHMHIEYGGRSYDINLKAVEYRSPAAHIPIN